MKSSFLGAEALGPPLTAPLLPADLHRVAALHPGDLREVLHSGEHAPLPAALQNHPERRRLQHEGKRTAVTPLSPRKAEAQPAAREVAAA